MTQFDVGHCRAQVLNGRRDRAFGVECRVETDELGAFSIGRCDAFVVGAGTAEDVMRMSDLWGSSDRVGSNTAPKPSPRVAAASLGGTITMTSVAADGQGVRPALTAQQLLEAVPVLAEIADLRATTLATLPGASLTFEQVLTALDWARAEITGGAAGAVIIQGTDTIEETAYLLDLYWDESAPLVVTGAMRSPQTPGADGPRTWWHRSG